MTFRCPACRTRRADYGLFMAHVRTTGHRVCNCGGYHYAHRPGSPFCVLNPRSELLEASRRGESSEVLLDIAAHLAWETKGTTGACPF